jgi:RNA polymerase sigma-70 factor (ECF subfamily)
VDVFSEAVMDAGASDGPLDLETVFHAQYGRVAGIITRVIRDPARAEEIAVDVFLKWSPASRSRGEKTEGWLYRVAVRMALDELRRQTRRSRYEHLLAIFRPEPTPEELHSTREEQDNVRFILSVLPRRQSELLLLRNEGLRYDELAAALDLNPASVGTLLSRAQQAFRKEYIQRYGEH